MGNRFAMTEAVAVLALIVHGYDILLPEDLAAQIKDRNHALAVKKFMSKVTRGVTHAPAHSFLRFRKRV